MAVDKINALSAEKVSTPIAFFTLEGGEKAQAVVLIGTDGNQIASWPLSPGAATDATQAQAVSALGQILTRLGQALPLPVGAATDAKIDLLVTAIGSLITEISAKTEPGDTQKVSATALPLPAGAATDSKLDEVIAKLPSSPATQATLVSVLAALQGQAAKTDTQPVSAVSLPLPSGAATQATLTAVLTALQGQLATNVGNFPANYPDNDANTKLAAVAGKLDVLATKLDALLTDAQLRTLPSGAATTAKQDGIAALATEVKTLSDTMLYFVTGMLDKMPALTSQDKAMVETSGGSISSITTVTAVTSVQGLGGSGGNASQLPWSLTAGATHIYNNISVTT